MTPPRLTGFLRWSLLQPQRAVGVLALAVALLLCAMVANDLSNEYAQQIVAADTRNASLTQLLEEHARQSMRRVELALSLAAQEVQTQAQTNGRVTVRTGTSLRAFLPQDGLIASFAVLDAKGMTIASTLTEDPAGMPLASDRDFFLAHQDPAQNGLFVGQAVKSRISGLWIIPVSMRLVGGFDGYLMGSVDPEYFQNLYRSIDIGDEGAVTLYSAQGWAVARWPFNSEIAGHNWLDTPLFKKHLAVNSTASVQDKDALDGIPMAYSYSALKEYPLVVVLGTSLQETLLPWRQHVQTECIRLLLVLLVLGASTRLLMAQLRRRVQVESALKLSEISVLKSSLPTLWIGSDGRILRVNQAACDLHGCSEQEMLAMSVPDLNPGMPWNSWPAHWQRLRAARNMRFETTHRNRLGFDVPVEIELNFIEFDGQEYNFAFIRDLTVRKQAEAEIMRGGTMLRGAIDAVDEAFVLFDTDDRLVYCNAKYLHLYPELTDVVVPGTLFEDMIRAGAQRGLYRESAGREEEWIAERMRAHRQGNEARIQKRDDGRVLRVIDRKTPDGNIVGIRVDITEMVRATEDAQEASRYKSQFLANMSHEIRTPMNAILGLLTLLQNTELSTVQRDYAAKTSSAAQSLLGLLNDILDFSKVEAGKMELDPQPFRLDRMLRDLAVILSSSMNGKPIEVLFDIDPLVPAVVVADALRLQQVLVNLGGNAIKFTAEGQVVLRVKCLDLPEPAITHEALVEFSIEDSGIGIAPEKQEHIFTGFSQAEASTTRRFGGTGLGLAICKRLVELMGGTLRLQSAPGVGSTFSFALRLPRAGAVLDEPAPAPQLSMAPLRVLVVDDNPVAADIVASIVRSWNWPVEQAASGAQALARMGVPGVGGAFPFDVIYLDWQMSGMDGWEVARQIRERSQGLAVAPRLVMLSANGRDTLAMRTVQEQDMVDGFLVKPVTASALYDAAVGRSTIDSGGRSQPRSSKRPLAGMRILVVEDNLINQQVAEELLHAEGATVALAANGQLGVDAVAASQPPFDVVLMDIQMPVLDGYGATRKIREELALTQLPIVAMTANAMDSDRQACLAAGMNEHVGKPFDMRHLVSVLLSVTAREPAPGDDLLPQDLPPLASANQFSSPYLDVDAAVERLSGLTALYVDVLQDFIQTLDEVEGSFRQAAAEGQVTALMAQMHSLKGTSATLGANRLSEHAALLEKLFRNPPANLVVLDQLPELLALVQASQLAGRQAVQSLHAAQNPEPERERNVAGPVERAAALAFLQDLSALLRASNLSALEQFKLRGHVLDALPAIAVEELRLALQALDLEAACRLCEVHIAALAEAIS